MDGEEEASQRVMADKLALLVKMIVSQNVERIVRQALLSLALYGVTKETRKRRLKRMMEGDTSTRWGRYSAALLSSPISLLQFAEQSHQ